MAYDPDLATDYCRIPGVHCRYISFSCSITIIFIILTKNYTLLIDLLKESTANCRILLSGLSGKNRNLLLYKTLKSFGKLSSIFIFILWINKILVLKSKLRVFVKFNFILICIIGLYCYSFSKVSGAVFNPEKRKMNLLKKNLLFIN